MNKVEVYENEAETFIYSSLWILDKKLLFKNRRRKSLLCILILMCVDIESLPGPNHTFAEIQYLSKQRGFSMYHQNIRGLDAHYEGLCEILDSHRSMNFISLSEIHTTEEEEKQYAIDGCKHFIRSRENREEGIKEGIKWDRRYNLESKNIECLWVEIFIK